MRHVSGVSTLKACFKAPSAKLTRLTPHSLDAGPIHIDSDVEGFETIVVNYGTDIPNLQGSHKRYLYGPGSILLAHSDHEHLNASHLLAAVEGYKRLVRSALKS